MDPILSLVGGVVQGVFGFLNTSKQAEIANNKIDAVRESNRLSYQKDVEAIWSNERIQGMLAQLAGRQSDNKADTDQTRAYYSYANGRNLSGALVAVAGVGLMGAALYFSRKEEK